VGISLVSGHAERSRPPRMLHCDFPLGRPLGRPGDPPFQPRVLGAAFALLPRNDVPVLVDYPDAIRDENSRPLSCRLPPRDDPTVPASVGEALALRPAYQRAQIRSARSDDRDGARIVERVELFDRLAAGEPWQSAGLSPTELHTAGLEVRGYYEQAALGLVDHVPAARQAESWFFQHTIVGTQLRHAQQRLRQADAPRPAWFGLAPSTQPRPD
jgi:hypothetical protein